MSFRIFPLEDYAILINSPGRDLAIGILDQQGRAIGLGDLQQAGLDGIFLTGQRQQQAKVVVLNRYYNVSVK